MFVTRSSKATWPFAFALLLGSLHGAAATTTNVDFTTIPEQSANGVTLDGVTFGYTEYGSPSPAALIDYDIGAGVTQLVPEFALIGYTDGVLTLGFAVPAPEVSFAVAETTNSPLTDGFSVSAFDATNTLLESTSVRTTPLALFSEGEFSYYGPAVSSISIAFDSADANLFAFGGLTYAVPEPSGIALIAAGLPALGLLAARRRRIGG